MQKIFLVTHASHSNSSGLSEYGREQAFRLAEKIKNNLSTTADVTIWTSHQKPDKDTAQIIKSELGSTNLLFFEKLSAEKQSEDFDWLRTKLDEFKGINLIIVSDLKYVGGFPEKMGFEKRDVGKGQGLCMCYEDQASYITYL